jgi:NADP-dependent 3-hydroxy acid dehydrogenase YdfG
MRVLTGKTAFVTGGASGIGFALGRAFAEAGMKVMLADIETDALAVAVRSLQHFGRNVRSVICDVADPVSVEGAAKASYETFGNVHVVCNNAGVGAAGGIDNISLDNWRWVLDVNVMGVLHGIRTFLPHIFGHHRAQVIRSIERNRRPHIELCATVEEIFCDLLAHIAEAGCPAKHADPVIVAFAIDIGASLD